MSGLIKRFAKKQMDCTWLCAGISLLLYRFIDLVKVSKDAASLVVCTRKKIFWLGCRLFVSDVMSGGLFGHLGQLHLALGANH